MKSLNISPEVSSTPLAQRESQTSRFIGMRKWGTRIAVGGGVGFGAMIVNQAAASAEDLKIPGLDPSVSDTLNGLLPQETIAATNDFVENLSPELQTPLEQLAHTVPAFPDAPVYTSSPEPTTIFTPEIDSAIVAALPVELPALADNIAKPIWEQGLAMMTGRSRIQLPELGRMNLQDAQSLAAQVQATRDMFIVERVEGNPESCGSDVAQDEMACAINIVDEHKPGDAPMADVYHIPRYGIVARPNSEGGLCTATIMSVQSCGDNIWSSEVMMEQFTKLDNDETNDGNPSLVNRIIVTGHEEQHHQNTKEEAQLGNNFYDYLAASVDNTYEAEYLADKAALETLANAANERLFTDEDVERGVDFIGSLGQGTPEDPELTHGDRTRRERAGRDGIELANDGRESTPEDYAIAGRGQEYRDGRALFNPGTGEFRVFLPK